MQLKSPIVIDFMMEQLDENTTLYFAAVLFFDATVGQAQRITEKAYREHIAPAPIEKLAVYLNQHLTSYCEALHG